jgi:hypothetical protein
MKKLFILLSSSLLLFTGVFAETSRRFSVGFNVGGCRIVENMDGYRIGGEFGFQISRRMGFLAEFGYAYNTSSYEGSSYTGKWTYSSVPVSASLVFITPVTENFSAHIGLGLGYYSIRFKSRTTYDNKDSNPYIPYPYPDPDYRVKGLAPHVCMVIEAAVSKQITMIAGVKQIIGKSELEGDSGSSKIDLYFSGPELKIGLRFYF